MSIPGMEDNQFGTYYCRKCGVRLIYGEICLDCKRASKGKPAYTRDQRARANLWDSLKGLVYLFVVFPVAVMLLMLLLNALEM